MTTVTSPVHPADPLLRLRESENFSWKLFETFSEQFIAAFSGQQPIHYGKRGEDQCGIDAFVDMGDAGLWTFQFRQVENFTVGDARKLVEETTYDGQRHFAFVACEVGTAVRDYERSLPDWQFWDVRDISLYVRTLPPEIGRPLVYQFFGNDEVKIFFEGSVVTSFVSPKLFFAPRGQRDLLRHDLPLVGRNEQLRQLKEFVHSDALVALLPGRGGIGKTRLLAELPTLAGTYEVRFATLVDLTRDSVSDLPIEPTIIIIDDAHDRDDIAIALETAKQRPIATKVVLATRPHATDEIRSALSRAGLGRDEICEITPLEELEPDETRKLISEVIGSGHDHLMSLVSSRTADSPVLAVVASRLLRTNGLNPAALASDEDVRFVVFDRLRDEMLARVVDVDQRRAKDLLTLLAAAGPLAIEAPQVVESVATFLDNEQDGVVQIVEALISAGIVRRRGSRVRVTPEVLSDFILERACVTKHGKATGYARRGFQHFRSVAGIRLLRNLAEVDWRIKNQNINARLLEPVWAEILDDFQQAGIIRRKEILTMVEAAAVYQPGEALVMAEYAMRHPVGPITPEEGRFKLGAELVLGHVPQILRRIAYHRECVARAARLLWEIGRDDARPTGSLPGHAFRLLCEMAGPHRHKPTSFRLAVVDAAAGWLSDCDVHDHVHSVLEIMEAALVRQGFDTWSEEAGSFKMAAYTIDRDEVLELHRRAINIVLQGTSSERPDVVLRSAKILIDQARPMISGTLGQVITAEQQAVWKGDRLLALKRLADIASTTNEPIVALEIRNGVQFTAHRANDPEIHDAAAAIVAAADARADIDDIDVLMDSWGHHTRVYADDGKWDIERSEQQNAVRIEAAAASFASRFTPESFAFFFNDIAVRARTLRVQFSPERLVYQLARHDVSYTANLLRYVFTHADDPIAAHAGGLLMNLSSADAIPLAREAIATNDVNLACAAAVILSVDRVWTADERSLFGLLIGYRDAAVRAKTLSHLRWPLKHNHQVIVDALGELEIAGSTLVAKELAELFNRHAQPVASLPLQTVVKIISKLVDVPDLRDYWISEFVSEAFVLAPETAVDMFLARIARQESAHDDHVSAVPHQFGVDIQRLGQHPQYAAALRKLRDASRSDSAWIGFYVPPLWYAVFNAQNVAARGVLDEWFMSGDGELIRLAGELLSQVDQDFVFEHRDYVVEILTEAWRVDPDAYDSVASRLHMPGVRSKRGTHGEPFPEDIDLRQKALAATEDLEPHGPAWRFYESLREFADREIERKLVRDQDEEEEYLD